MCERENLTVGLQVDIWNLDCAGKLENRMNMSGTLDAEAVGRAAGICYVW